MPSKYNRNQIAGSILKKTISSEEIEIYNLYIQRIMKQYELRLTHFTIYFGFQSGLSAVVGYLIQPHIVDYPKIPHSLLVAFIALGVVGALFALAWMLVVQNDRTIQLLLNEVIGDMEKEIFENHHLAAYLRINAFYSPKAKIGIDVIDVNFYMAIIFLVAWFIFTGVIIYALF